MTIALRYVVVHIEQFTRHNHKIMTFVCSSREPKLSESFDTTVTVSNDYFDRQYYIPTQAVQRRRSLVILHFMMI